MKHEKNRKFTIARYYTYDGRPARSGVIILHYKGRLTMKEAKTDAEKVQHTKAMVLAIANTIYNQLEKAKVNVRLTLRGVRYDAEEFVALLLAENIAQKEVKHDGE